MISLQKIVILFFLYTSLAHSAVVFKNGKRVDEPNDLKEEKAKQKDTNISSNPEVVDEERFTSGGQWEISSNDKGFIKYQEQQSKIIINSEDDLDGRSFIDQEDITDDYQIHPIYILASDSKDKKYDLNGTLVKILERSNQQLLKYTDEQKFRYDFTKEGNIDLSFIRVNKTKKEINRLENAAGYFTGMAALNGFHHPKKIYAIFYQDTYGREWGQLGDALFSGPKGEVEIASGVTYLGKELVNEGWIPNTHELFHAFGFVQLCAPNAIIEKNSPWGKNDHTTTSNEMMGEGGGDLYGIDTGRNQYYDHSNSNCEMDLKKSAYLEPTEQDFQLQPRSESCKLTRWQPKYRHERSLDCLDKLNF